MRKHRFCKVILHFMLSNNFESELHRILINSGKSILKTRNIFNIKEKDENEIVTTADIISNDIIINFLKSRYPKIPRYSEESEKSNKSTRWIIDPLDGTTPWLYGNSGFSISIALEKDGFIVLGAIYDPVMKEFFYAEKDRGACRNGFKISVSKETDVRKMLLVVDWGNKDEKGVRDWNISKRFFYRICLLEELSLNFLRHLVFVKYQKEESMGLYVMIHG